MEIDAIVLILDILAAAGYGIISSGNRKRIERAMIVGLFIPIAIFAAVMIKDFTLKPEFFEVLTQQFLTLMMGIIAGALSGTISSAIVTLVKRIFS